MADWPVNSEESGFLDYLERRRHALPAIRACDLHQVGSKMIPGR